MPMISPVVANGWLKVPCEAYDLAKVELATGQDEPGEWKPAFRDWHNGSRVAQVRVYLTGPAHVWLRVDGQVAAKYFVKP